MRVFLNPLVVRVAATVAVLIGHARSLFAQTTPAPNVSINRSYWVEIVLIALLFGVALFAVCRPGHRR